MSLHPTGRKRTRAYNIFVLAFFFAVAWAMLIADEVTEGDWSIVKFISANAGLCVGTIIALVSAVIYYRGAKRA